MMKEQTYNVDKLLELKESIQKKRDELFIEINQSLGNGDLSTYNQLKQSQLQCDAELRLIKYIHEDKLDGEFFLY